MSATHQSADTMKIPATLSSMLLLVSVGKAAIAGAGATLALLGAYDVAVAISTQEWLRSIKPEYLDYLTLGGGTVGALIGLFTNR